MQTRDYASALHYIFHWRYRAGIHVHYQETKLRMKDGLPKMKDVPKEMGGSGVSVAE